MDSLNDIIQERKKSRGKNNSNYQNILESTPQTIRVHNALDNQAVLIEKINSLDQQAQYYHNHIINEDLEDGENSGSSRPPSRIALDNQVLNNLDNSNNGILRMTPRSQQKFFTSLEQICKEQDQAKLRSDFIEEPESPEFTIVQAIDDSCILFAVRDPSQTLPAQQPKSESDSNDSSNFNSAIKMQSPNVNRNFFDTESSGMNDPDIIKLLASKLQGIENQENNPSLRRNEAINRQQMRGGLLVEQYSVDRQFLMIHPIKLKKLTPSIKAPKISRQPSFKNIDYFDLSDPYHAQLLCLRLQQITNLENESIEYQEQEDNQEVNEFEEEGKQEVEIDIEAEADDILNEEQQNNLATPAPTRGPPSRGGNQEIDIDLLISKLLEIPNDELLDSLLNLSVSDESQLLFQTQQVNQQLNCLQQGRDSEGNSDFNSSGIQTPGSNSFSTPIQAKLFQDRGNLINGGKPQRGLDLRSPQTKFNLMRKLQEVKELNNSSEEDNISSREDRQPIAGDPHPDLANQIPRYHPDFQENMISQPNQRIVDQRNGLGIEIRSVNDFTRMFINEEDEDDDSEQDCISNQEQSTNPISLLSPQRSLNTTMTHLQLRNLSNNNNNVQTPPLIEMLIMKLKRLEEKRMKKGRIVLSSSNQNSARLISSSEDQSCHSSESQSPDKFQDSNSQSASNILEQVIKRLERLKRKQSRDSSV